MPDRVIHWFRRDLRLHDNTAIGAALISECEVIPLFLLDHRILGQPSVTAARRAELRAALQNLDAGLRERGSRLLVVETDDAPRELNRVAEETGAWSVYFNRDYTRYARLRDTRATRGLQMTGVVTQVFDDLLLVDPYLMLDDDGQPPADFNEFEAIWIEALDLGAPAIIEAGTWMAATGLPESAGWDEVLGSAPGLSPAEGLAGLHLGTTSARAIAREILQSAGGQPALESAAGKRLRELARRDYAYLMLFLNGHGRSPDQLT